MYSFSITEQLVVFIESIGFGVLLAVGYGAVDVAVSVFLADRKKRVACDIIFSLLCAVSLFSFMLAYNLGKLRLYMVLGIVIGLTAYLVAFGAYAAKACEKVTSGIRHFFFGTFSVIKRAGVSMMDKLKRTQKKPKKEKKTKKMRKTLAKEKESVV